MKLVIEIDPKNDYEIIDAIEMLKSLPAFAEPDDLPSLDEGENGERLRDAAARSDEPQGISAGKFRDLVAQTQAARAEAQAPAPAAEVSEADAIAAMQDLVKRNGAAGIAKAIDVLNEFGAARVTELKAEQRGAFIEKAKAA